MGSTDRFSREEVQRILDLTPRQLDYWDRLRLVSSQKEQNNRFYDFRDIIGLRTVKQLTENGVPAQRLGRALAALRKGILNSHAPLNELRVLSDGRDVIVERDGVRLNPLSGQLVMNFDTREIGEKVRVMSGRSAEDLFEAALDSETEGRTAEETIEAYERALVANPQKIEALINCGTLYYELGNLEKAEQYFRRAMAADSASAIACSNLGSVLEELGHLEEARHHLRSAVRLEPGYSDARYTLALVCEQMNAFAEARDHWQQYVSLDPQSPWSDFARKRIVELSAVKSAHS
ncbi:MAG: tetratricopeptide repeat protein [Acidobacteria bacterium]|nr:tetratricopeptide repeat protein [Acidobacteriota bacterium]MBS1867411.1 tetratricopeptide repeat protein [Acidobacteriota bacterium]